MRGFSRNDKIHGLRVHSRRGKNHSCIWIKLSLVHESKKHIHSDRPHPYFSHVECIKCSYIPRCKGNVLVELPQILENTLPGIHFRLLKRAGNRIFLVLACFPLYPGHRKGYSGHSSLYSVVAELFGVGLYQFHKFFESFGRILHIIRVICKCSLAVKHGHGISFDINPQRLFRKGGK